MNGETAKVMLIICDGQFCASSGRSWSCNFSDEVSEGLLPEFAQSFDAKVIAIADDSGNSLK